MNFTMLIRFTRKGAIVVGVALAGLVLLPPASRAQSPASATMQEPEVDRSADGDDGGAVARYRDLYSKLSERGIRLKLGSIVPGSSLAAGAELEKDRLFGTFIGASIQGAWSVRGYHEYSARLGKIKGREHRTEIASFDTDISAVFNDNSLLAFGTSVFGEWRKRIYPRVDFFGLGQASTVAGRSDFGLEGTSRDLVVQWQRDRHVGLSGRLGLLDLTVEPGRNRGVPDTHAVYSPLDAPGLDAQPRYLVSGIGGTLDYRDRPHFTSTGVFVGVALWHANTREDVSPVASPAQGWTRLIAETRYFHPLAGSAHVLALRGLLSTRVGETQRATPFYLQPTLGGSKTLRGFGSYRLRGDALWSATAEYRWRAHRWIEIAPFVDLGAVAKSFGDFANTRLTASPGIGLRATSRSRVIGRLDIARGRDGARMLLSLSAPF